MLQLQAVHCHSVGDVDRSVTDDDTAQQQGLTRENRSSSVRSATLPPIVREEEDHQRLFFTRSDPRRVRTLKSLRLLPATPSTVTYAEVGVQVALPPDVAPYQVMIEAMKNTLTSALCSTAFTCKDVECSKMMLADLEEILADLAQSVIDLVDTWEDTQDEKVELEGRLADREREVDVLGETLHRQTRDNEELTTQMANLERENGTARVEGAALRAEVSELQATVDRLRLEVAFLQEDKECLERDLADRKAMLEVFTSERSELRNKVDELKEAILDHRLKSTDTIGRYLAELNLALADKQSLLRAQFSGTSKEIKKMLTTTDSNMKLEQENHRLVDQVEVLSTQAVAQDLQLEQLHGQLAMLTKIFEDLKARGRDVTTSDMFHSELQRAKELVERPVGSGLARTGTDGQLFLRELSVKQYRQSEELSARKTMSLPSSPIKVRPRGRSPNTVIYKTQDCSVRERPPTKSSKVQSKPVRGQSPAAKASRQHDSDQQVTKSYRTGGNVSTVKVDERLEGDSNNDLDFYSPYTSPRGVPSV